MTKIQSKTNYTQLDTSFESEAIDKMIDLKIYNLFYLNTN